MTAAALQALRAAEEEAEEHESRKSLHIAKLGEPFVVQKKGALLGTATGPVSGSSKSGSTSRKSIAGGRGFVRVGGAPRESTGADSSKSLQYELESLPDDDSDDDRSLESLVDDSGDEQERSLNRSSPAPKVQPLVTRPISISRPISTSRLLPLNHTNEAVLTERSRDALKSSKEVSEPRSMHVNVVVVLFLYIIIFCIVITNTLFVLALFGIDGSAQRTSPTAAVHAEKAAPRRRQRLHEPDSTKRRRLEEVERRKSPFLIYI